jgi:hypothetical protein
MQVRVAEGAMTTGLRRQVRRSSGRRRAPWSKPPRRGTTCCRTVDVALTDGLSRSLHRLTVIQPNASLVFPWSSHRRSEPPPPSAKSGDPGFSEIPDNDDDDDDDPKIIKPVTSKKSPPPLPPLQWLDMSNWDDEPRPEREWAILYRLHT